MTESSKNSHFSAKKVSFKRISKSAATLKQMYISIFDAPQDQIIPQEGLQSGIIKLRNPGIAHQSVRTKYLTLSYSPLQTKKESPKVLSGRIDIPVLTPLTELIVGRFIILSDNPPSQVGHQTGLLSGTLELPSYGRYNPQFNKGGLKYLTVSPSDKSSSREELGVVIGKILDLSPGLSLISHPTELRRGVQVYRGKQKMSLKPTFEVVSKPSPFREMLLADAEALKSGTMQLISPEEVSSLLDVELNQLRAVVFSKRQTRAKGYSHTE